MTLVIGGYPMLRFCISFLAAFALLYVQSLIVMRMNGYSTIHFDNMLQLTVIWIVNFCLSFAIITHIQPWLEKTRIIPETVEEEG
jgi:hypothetical protein